jgi:methyl-accepting chemotaxis protein
MSMRRRDPFQTFLLSAIVAMMAVAVLVGGALAWRLNLGGSDAVVLVLIALGGGLFFLAALFVSMKRVLDRPLADLDAYLRQIAQGNFSAIVPDMPGEGRFDSLQKSLQVLSEFLSMNGKALHEASQKVRRHAMNLSTAAEEMNAASQEITSTVQQISRGMETQASRTSETSEVMVSMSQTVKQMADKSAAVAEASAQAWETALSGGESVKDAVRKISEIAANAGESARTVEGLGRTSKKIGQVVQIITGIADQTNLLALNAAIEAARAGEAGRGFAVVAEEVRKLAEGSAKAAGEINKLVREIQTETDRAVARMADAAAELKEGREVVHSAGGSLEEILKVVRRVDELAKEIFQLTQKQAAATDQVVKAVEEIASVAEETAAGTEQASASTEEQTASMEEMVGASRELASTAEQLSLLVRRFRSEP